MTVTGSTETEGCRSGRENFPVGYTHLRVRPIIQPGTRQRPTEGRRLPGEPGSSSLGKCSTCYVGNTSVLPRDRVSKVGVTCPNSSPLGLPHTDSRINLFSTYWSPPLVLLPKLGVDKGCSDHGHTHRSPSVLI